MKKRITIKESAIRNYIKHLMVESNSNLVYYHGGDASDDLFYNGVAWLSDEPWYAYQYAKDNKNPCILKIALNQSILNCASLYDLGDSFDPYEGPDENTKEYMKQEGYNAYSFPISWDGYETDCVVLLDESPIISMCKLSNEEYNEIENSDY